MTNMLVDSTSNNELLGFMDSFFRYNIILIYVDDISKTALRCLGSLGMFRWIFMPFGLKNASITYQRAMCTDPRARPDPIGESEPKPRESPFNSFHLHFITFSFSKIIPTRIPSPTRMVDPNRSPVYSDFFIYLIKTFY